jgi:phenylpyruvate tautomerase
MPRLLIRTNADAPRGDLTALALDLSKKLSELIEKPEQYIGIDIQTNQILAFGGDADTPCAFCSLTSIGNIDLEHNTKISAMVAHALTATFGVAATRYYLAFDDYERHNMGYNSHTFANQPAAKKQEE